MALLGQNSVGEPSIIVQYPMFVRTGTHEWTTALKPLHPSTLCISEGKRSTPNNFNGGILTNAQVRSIMQASEWMQAFVTFEPLVTSPSGENKYPNCWMLSISTALSDRLAHKHRFNRVFPLCLVCLDLQFRWGPNWPLWKNGQCCGLGCPHTTKKSVIIFVIFVTCNLYKHTSGNVWWQYYPKYIALGNDRICNASVHCLHVIIGTTLPHSTEHGDDTPHVECILKTIRRAASTSSCDELQFLERYAWAYWL